MARAIASSSSSGPSLMSKDYRIPSTSHTSYHRHPPPVVMTTTNDPMISTSRTTSLAGKKRTRESDGDAKTRAFRRTKSVGDHSRSPKDKEKDRDRVGFQRSLIAAFVPAALRESLMGNMTNYNDLVIHFQGTSDTESPSLSPLQPLLRALTSHVNLLVPDVHAGLISAIIALPWATGDEKFLRTFVGFCGVLVSAQPAWAKEVVNMAVRGLSWQLPISSSTVDAMSRRMYHARHHLLLSHLLSLIPTLSTVLQPLVVRHFPQRREPEVSQTTFVRNCCELVTYCPEIGQRVWSEILDRMLRIDLEIINILEEDDDDENEDDDDEMDGQLRPDMSISSSLDPFVLLVSQDVPVTEEVDDEETSDVGSDLDPGELSSVDGDRSDDEKEEKKDGEKAAAERQKRRLAVKSMRHKLDGMLLYFMEHLEECMGGKTAQTPAAELAAAHLTNDSGSGSGASTPTPDLSTPGYVFPSTITRRPPPTAAQSLAHFQTLLHLFTRQILPTSSTQHVPFILFLTASLSPSHTDLFLGLLVSQALYATSTTTPTANSRPLSLASRVASTVYIGSLVCRARFVSDDQARQVMTYLLAFMDGKMQQIKPDELQLFYAVSQAVMLIFCFRWRAFLSDDPEGDAIIGEMEMDGDSLEGDGKWIKDLEVLQRAITSELNPLMGCNPDIVNTFAKIAHQTNFAYCFSIIEANQQNSSRQLPPTTPMISGNMTRQHPSRQSSISSSISLSQPRAARQANIDAGLDAYFPYDPYHLPRSRSFIDPLYRTWEEAAASDIESDDEEEESGVTSDDGGSTLEDGFSTSRSRSVPKIGSGSFSNRRRRMLTRGDGLSSSLEGMSISPAVSGGAGK